MISKCGLAYRAYVQWKKRNIRGILTETQTMHNMHKMTSEKRNEIASQYGIDVTELNDYYSKATIRSLEKSTNGD